MGYNEGIPKEIRETMAGRSMKEMGWTMAGSSTTAGLSVYSSVPRHQGTNYTCIFIDGSDSWEHIVGGCAGVDPGFS